MRGSWLMGDGEVQYGVCKAVTRTLSYGTVSCIEKIHGAPQTTQTFTQSHDSVCHCICLYLCRLPPPPSPLCYLSATLCGRG